MKFRVFAILLIAANFAFTQLAQAQQMMMGGGMMMNPGMMGTGAVGGGMTTCAYPSGPANGAYSEDDELSDLQNQKRDLTKDIREFRSDVRRLERDLARSRAVIEERFKTHWASVMLEHMDKGMNCSLCGPTDSYPAPPPPPPPYPTDPISPPPPPPPPPAPPVYEPPTPLPPVEPPVQEPPRPRPPQQERPDPVDVPRRCSECSRLPANRQAACRATCELADNRSVFPVQTGGRMPASEVGGSGSIVVAPVPAAGAVASDNPWANEPTTFNVSVGGSSETGGPMACYDRSVEPYARPTWQPPTGICRPGGNISAQACRIGGYLNSTDRNKESECVDALAEYRETARDLQEKRADLSLAENELRRVNSDIRKVRRENARDARDNEGMEAGGGGRNVTVVQPRRSIWSSLAPVLAGALVGGGLEYMNYRNSNRNNDRLNELGWPTLPYQSNGYGLMVGAGVYGAVAGAQNGAFGCGQMMGNNGMGPFGNPYMQGGPMMGGGMFNGGYGYPGMGGGYPGVGGFAGGFAGGIQGGGYPGMMGMQGGGFPGGGYPGMAGGGFPGGGYPGMQGGNYIGGFGGGIIGAYQGGFQGGFQGGGFPGMQGGMYAGQAGGGFPGGGYPGMAGYGGMYAGQAGGGFPGGGYPGMAGYAGGAPFAGMASYAGVAGGGLGIEYQQQMAQMQLEYQQRAAANELARTQQQQGLMGQYYELMYKFNQLQSGGGIGSSYQYPSYGSSYPTIGVGGSIGGITGGISGGVSGTTILPTTPATTVPSRSR